MHDLPTKITASAIVSELQSSDIHMTIKARLFDLKANLNGVRVTEGFLDEIIQNESKYQCIGLYADLRGLLANRTIGHMYNRRTGEFGSTMIGSFYRYEKEVDGDNTYLVGYARLPKRNKAVCKAISELFADGNLKFSFEITCGEYTKMPDGTRVIDASDANYFEGEAVVTFPACEDAVALELVAECLGKGDEDMADEKNKKTDEEIDTTANETQKETAETEVADRVIIHENHVEHHLVEAYNCEDGSSTSQRVTVETNVSTPIDTNDLPSDNAYVSEKDESFAEKKDDDTPVCDDAEPATDENTEDTDAQASEVTSSNEKTDENGSCKKKECQSETTENPEDQQDEKQNASIYADLFENIMAELKEIKKQLSELKNVQAEEHIAAEANAAAIAEVQQTAEETINPFMSSMTAPKSGKYSLLEKEKKKPASYTLLERI